MTKLGKWVMVSVLGMVGLGGVRMARAEDARQIVQAAVAAEQRAAKEDQSRWRYRDDEQVKRTVSIVVQTDAGSVKRLIERDGKPISAEEAKAEDARIEAFVRNGSALARQKKDAEADDKSATELMTMLPDAFTWRIVGEDASTWTLAFQPNANFHPPDMQSRVLGAMGGELVVDKGQHRIKTISGKLTQDVMIGYGILGRLRQGGVFRVERREVKPRMWQITETHVHIDGKALMFKSIGQDQDEMQTEWLPVPGGTTLEAAAVMSRVGR